MPNSIKVEIELEGKDALRTLTLLNKNVKNLGKTGTKSIKTMDLAMASFVGNLGSQAVLRSFSLISRGFQQSAKNALDFGKAVAEVNSIVPRTAAETLALKQQLIGLSNEFGSKSQSQARAFYNILSAGITETSKALNVLETSNKAAVAGLVDTDTAARGLISVTKSYTDGSVNAAEASDILFVAVREGRTTFGELADTIGRVASISSSANVAFSEVAGTLAFVTKSGIRTDEAVIGLRQLFTSIIGPTDDVTKKAKELGIEFNATALETKGLGGFLTDLREKTGGNVEAIRKLFPNVRAFNVAIKVAGGDLDDFNRILDETSKATGATDKAFQIISNSASFQFTKLLTQFENFPTAILTNFDEPISDALKTVNEFVGSQGVLLVADAVDIIIDSFNELAETKDDVTDFFDSVGQLASEFVNTISGIDEVTTESLRDDLSQLEQKLKDVKEIQDEVAQSSFNAGDSGKLAAQEAAINKEIALTKTKIEVFQAADIEEAKIAQKENARREARLARIQEFQAKIEAGRKAQIASEAARIEEQKAKDEAAAQEKLDKALGRQTSEFQALQELKAAQKEEESALVEEEKIAKQLEAEEEFQFLADNLGRQATLKELNRIKDIDNEKKRQKELLKLRDKARKQEQSGILSLRKFEDLTNKEKLAGQKSTLASISTLSQSSNSTLFAIGKAAALTLAGINTAKGVTLALATIPPPFGFAAAAAVGAAGAIQIANIASAKKPSAGSFQSGGIIEGTSQSGDQLTANVNSGEAIFNQRQQKNLFRAINNNQLGGGGAGITINNPVFMNEEMVDDVIDQINDRVEFGNKQLLASEVA